MSKAIGRTLGGLLLLAALSTTGCQTICDIVFNTKSDDDTSTCACAREPEERTRPVYIYSAPAPAHPNPTVVTRAR